MREYPGEAWERAMTEKEVILRAVAKEIKWIEAAAILGVTPRTMRRKYDSYKEYGIDGLVDKRRSRPSGRRVPYAVVEEVLGLYRGAYAGFNVQHFHEELVAQHGLRYSYSWLKNLLQEAGYVPRGRSRGGHRRRRERRRLFGELLHLDGSDHEWLSLRPGERQVLLLVIDDSTSMNLAGRLVAGETTRDCLSIMREVVEGYGVPMSLYTDRARVYWYTAESGGRVDRDRLTQFGRAMSELGVEMIAAYSPQARGRSERMNGTWQGRLVNELRFAGIDNVEEANRYISEVFMPKINRLFTVEAAERGSGFIRVRGSELERIFSLHHGDRTVSNDNTLRVNNLVLQLEGSRYRSHFVRCQVLVYEQLSGGYTVYWNHREIGRYDSEGLLLTKRSGGRPPAPRSLSPNGPEKRRKEKRRKTLSSSSASSPVTPEALRSVSTVALSSSRVR